MAEIRNIITTEHFKRSTGRDPEHDDLDRCNCNKLGQPGHYLCGWDDPTDLPKFEAVALKRLLS